MILKILWSFICLSVLYVGLNEFFDFQRWSYYFKISDQASPLKFSICFQMEFLSMMISENYTMIPAVVINELFYKFEQNFDLKKEKFLVDLNEKRKIENTIEELTEKFVNLNEKINENLNGIRRNLEEQLDTNSFRNLVKKEESYMKFDLFCLLIDKRFLNYLFIFNDLNYTLYAFSVKPTFDLANLILDHKHKGHSGLRLSKKLINKCPDDKSKMIKHRFYECLNDCLVSKERKAIYMYKITDEQEVDLKNRERSSEQEKECYGNCSKNYCFEETYISANCFEGIETKIFFSETYKDPIFNFCFQFVSLVFLFLNISFYELAIKLFQKFEQLLSKILNNESPVRFAFPQIKWLIFGISFILTILNSLIMTRDYIEALKNPIRTEVSNITDLPETFSLIICVPVQLNLNRRIKLELKKDENIFKKYPFESIENYTNDDLNIILKQAYLKKGSQMRKANLNPSEKVYFKANYFEYLNTSFISRCFRIELEIQIIVYEDMQLSSNLLLELNEICYYKNKITLYGYEFRDNLCQVYVLEHFKTFSFKTLMHKNFFQINKRRIKRSRSFMQRNCSDYADSELNCFDQQNCIESCVNTKFLKAYKSLTTESKTVIDKDRLDQNLLSKLYFNESSDVELIKKCKKQFELQDCFNSFFIESYRKLNQEELIELNLDFENIEEKEFESSIPNLMINLFSVIILTFGININVFSNYFSFFLRVIVKLNRKLIKYLILILCITGFLSQFTFIYFSIVKAPMVSSGRHRNFVYFQKFIFCFEYSNNDPNFELTGSYLENLTSNLTIQNAIENLTFLDEEDQMNALNVSASHTFFFSNKKCFLIQILNRSTEIYFRSDSHPIKIRFNRTLLEKIDKIHFKNSDHYEAILDKQFDIEFESINLKQKKYLIKTEYFSIYCNDQFSIENFKYSFIFLINRLTFRYFRLHVSFVNYFEKILNEFNSKFNYTTLKFQLLQSSAEKSLPNQEINNDLFEQFYNQREDTFGDYYRSFTYRDVFLNYLQIFNKSNDQEFDLELQPVFNGKSTDIENDEGLPKFIIAILNALSFWFNMSIFNLNPFILITHLHPYLLNVLSAFVWLNRRFSRPIIQKLIECENFLKNKQIDLSRCENRRKLMRNLRKRLKRRRIKRNRVAQIETIVETEQRN